MRFGVQGSKKGAIPGKEHQFLDAISLGRI